MRLEIAVEPEASTNEFADVRIRVPGGPPVLLDVAYKPFLAQCGYAPEVTADLLLIAAAVYAIDKSVRRGGAPDRWTRELEVAFPVSDPQRWERALDPLQACLSFLTGDVWRISFTTLPGAVVRPAPSRRQVGSCADVSAVCLFSGGLDSLIGAIDWLDTNVSERILLVGHYDRHASLPHLDQERLFGPLQRDYQDRVVHLSMRVGQMPAGSEITFRSRSLLFLALGLHAAAAVGANVPVLIPENGTIALNVPLTPARRGSCSTRTAHPHYLALLEEALASVGITNRIQNPLSTKTKGECVRECRNPALLGEVYGDAISCAKRGHNRSWRRQNAKQCGRCMPCIYRRAALESAGLDTEVYGSDILNGEVPLDGGRVSSHDLRACLSFLRAHPSERELARLLLTNGSIPVTDLREAALIVARAMDEIRNLLRRPETLPEVRARAGIA